MDRPYGRNTAGLIVGMVTRPTPRYPEGMTRVAMFGDPTKALGTVAEAECARVVAALDLAEKLSVPVEWFALVLRRHHFDGERHREHGLGVPRAAPNHHVHPETAVRSTSSSRESTSARSRIGTPKRRC